MELVGRRNYKYLQSLGLEKFCRIAMNPGGINRRWREGGGAMRYLVPEDVQREATKCTSSLSCLSGTTSPDDGHHRCSVDYVLKKNLMFVKPKELQANFCPYKLNYGAGHVCQCPVRYHLFITGRQP